MDTAIIDFHVSTGYRNAITFTNDEVLRGALVYLNAARRSCGAADLAEMPKGYPGDPCECPIGVAFDFLTDVEITVDICIGPRSKEGAQKVGSAWGLDITECNTYRSGYTFIVPPAVIKEFRERFDLKAYPDLCLKQ